MATQGEKVLGLFPDQEEEKGRVLPVALPPLHPGQQKVEDADARFTVVCAGRRWGKTRYGVRSCLKWALQGGRAWWVAPTYKLAQEGWIPLRQMAHQIPGAKVRETDKELWLPTGGRVGVRSADNPDMLRGAGLDFVVLDEAAYCPERLWHEILRPALADRKGSALFISTPIGFNWFYDLWELAESNDQWARFHAPSYDNPFLEKEELDSALAEVGSHVFSQEFMAEFVEVGGSVFKENWFKYFDQKPLSRYVPVLDDKGKPTGDTSEEIEVAWILDGGHIVRKQDTRRFIVVDPAVSLKEHADYTAIAAVASTPERDMLVLDMLRQRIEGPDILKYAEHMRQKWDAGIIYLESAAFQLLLIQQARRDGLPVKEVRADRDKLSRALPLSAHMEAGKVYFRRGAEWLDELKKELLVFPKEEQHDDQVDALAYAMSQLGRRVEWAAY